MESRQEALRKPSSDLLDIFTMHLPPTGHVSPELLDIFDCRAID